MQTFALTVVVLQLPTYAQYEYSISYCMIKLSLATNIACPQDNIILQLCTSVLYSYRTLISQLPAALYAQRDAQLKYSLLSYSYKVIQLYYIVLYSYIHRVIELSKHTLAMQLYRLSYPMYDSIDHTVLAHACTWPCNWLLGQHLY